MREQPTCQPPWSARWSSFVCPSVSLCSSESLQPRLAYLARDVPARAAVRQQQRSKHRGEERRANLGLRPLVEQDLPHGGKHELTAEHAARVRNDGRVGILRSFLRRLRRKKKGDDGEREFGQLPACFPQYRLGNQVAALGGLVNPTSQACEMVAR